MTTIVPLRPLPRPRSIADILYESPWLRWTLAITGGLAITALILAALNSAG